MPKPINIAIKSAAANAFEIKLLKLLRFTLGTIRIIFWIHTLLHFLIAAVETPEQ